MALEIPSQIKELFENSTIPLTLSDVNALDEPLVFANRPFFRMTEFSESEALGSNCRFMQGKATQQAARNTIRGDFAANRDSTVLIRNYRKSGEVFDNYLYIFTLLDDANAPIMRIGSQFEVPAIKRASAFSEHANELLDGLSKVNASGDLRSRHLIETGQLVGASVKSLLMARLENLRVS